MSARMDTKVPWLPRSSAAWRCVRWAGWNGVNCVGIYSSPHLSAWERANCVWANERKWKVHLAHTYSCVRVPALFGQCTRGCHLNRSKLSSSTKGTKGCDIYIYICIIYIYICNYSKAGAHLSRSNSIGLRTQCNVHLGPLRVACQETSNCTQKS